MYEKAQAGQRFGNLVLVSFDKEKRKWLCDCDCGGHTYCNITDMKKGRHTRCKCGILQARPHTRMGDKLGLKRKLYRRYKKGADCRGIEFNLSFEDVIRLTQQKCDYCGVDPDTVMTMGKYQRYTHNGIDRVDNNKGYTVDNSVTCCSKCNYSKKENTLNDWLGWIKRVYEHQFKEG